MKKINGWLIVRFNERERREYEELGAFGVIDAEAYTGSIDIDRGEMEYDDAETIEQAVEQARGLDSEEDYALDAPSYTVVKETADSYTEKVVSPATLARDFEETLADQVEDPRYSSVNCQIAAAALRGFMVALDALGMAENCDVDVKPDHFYPIGPQAGTFRHAKQAEVRTARQMYALGKKLSESCPANDCTLYLNIFNMLCEMDDQLDRVTDYPWIVLHGAFEHEFFELEQLYLFNAAVKDYRHAAGDLPRAEPVKAAAPEPPKAPEEPCGFLYTPNQISDREITEMSKFYVDLPASARVGDIYEFARVFERCISLNSTAAVTSNSAARPRLFSLLGDDLVEAWKLYYKSPEICAYLREQEKAKKEPPAEQAAREPVSDPNRYEEIEKEHPYTAEAMTGRTLPYQPGDKTIDRLQGVMEEVSRRQTGRQGA